MKGKSSPVENIQYHLQVKMFVAVFFVLAVYLGGGWSKHPARPAAQTDPEMVQYLQDQFARAKDLNRPMVNGEVNLLPQGMEGFSNGIRCFFGKFSHSLLIVYSSLIKLANSYSISLTL